MRPCSGILFMRNTPKKARNACTNFWLDIFYYFSFFLHFYLLLFTVAYSFNIIESCFDFNGWLEVSQSIRPQSQVIRGIEPCKMPIGIGQLQFWPQLTIAAPSFIQSLNQLFSSNSNRACSSSQEQQGKSQKPTAHRTFSTQALIYWQIFAF